MLFVIYIFLQVTGFMCQLYIGESEAPGDGYVGLPPF